MLDQLVKEKLVRKIPGKGEDDEQLKDSSKDLSELENEFIKCSLEADQKKSAKIRRSNLDLLALSLAILAAAIVIVWKSVELSKVETELSNAETLLPKASEYEFQAFNALLKGNLIEAQSLFNQAYDSWNIYHSVDEILHKVLTDEVVNNYENSSDKEQEKKLRQIMANILTNYSYGMPTEIKKKMTIKVLNDYKIEIFYNQEKDGLKLNAEKIQQELLKYGLSKEKIELSPKPKSWFTDKGGISGDINTIRYEQPSEYEVAYILINVFYEVNVNLAQSFQLYPLPTYRSPNYVSIFLLQPLID